MPKLHVDITLCPEVLAELDDYCRKFKVSRGGAVGALLAQATGARSAKREFEASQAPPVEIDADGDVVTKEDRLRMAQAIVPPLPGERVVEKVPPWEV